MKIDVIYISYNVKKYKLFDIFIIDDHL